MVLLMAAVWVTTCIAAIQSVTGFTRCSTQTKTPEGKMKHDQAERERRKKIRDRKKADKKSMLRTTGQPGGNSHDRRKALRKVKRDTEKQVA
jgi:hypothetical protein